MIAFRKKLSEYKELFFLCSVLIMGEIASAGFDSSNIVYKILFLLAAGLWAVKMVLTDYRIKDMVVIAIIFGLLGLVLLRNHERTLIITAMAITGAKDVKKDKVLLYTIISKAMVTILITILACFDLVENTLFANRKGDVISYNYCLGFNHPNKTYMNLFMILMMLVVLLKDRMKWYFHLLLLGIMYGAYKLLACRTGFLVWCLLTFSVLVYQFLKKTKLGSLYVKLMGLIAPGLTVFTFVTAALYSHGNSLIKKLDRILHNRISLVAKRMGEMPTNFIGASQRRAFDNGYFHLLYNYGWIFGLLAIVVLSLSIVYLANQNMIYEAIGLGITAVYIYMEYATLSTTWNYCLIFIACFLFRPYETGSGFKKKGRLAWGKQ